MPELKAALAGRCISSTAPLNVVESGDPSRPDELFLSPHDHSKSAVRQQLPQGSQFLVIEVLYERSFEYSAVKIVGRSMDGRYPRLDLSLLFDTQWALRAEHVAAGSLDQVPRLDTALEDGIATWCEDHVNR
ncbi:MAG: hypothetical protein ACREQV_25065 [Candidatus Binatia bacterium]